MEVIGVIGSSIAIFDALQKLRRYARDVINAPVERDDFNHRLNCVEAVIKAVDGVEGAAAPDAAWIKELNPKVENSPIFRLLRTMEKMADILKIDVHDESLKAKFKKYKWHSEKKELEILLSAVKDHCIVILVILQWGDIEIQKAIGLGLQSLVADVAANKALIEESRKRRDGVDVVILRTASDVADGRLENKEGIEIARRTAIRLNSVESMLIAEEAAKLRDRELAEREREKATRKKIEKWLSPLEFQQRHQTIFENAAMFRKGQVGDWFFECEEFRLWRDGVVQTLWGYGAPGSGKTVLSSVVIDEMKNSFPQTPVLCIYFEKTEGHIQTPKNIRGSLLKQLIQFKKSGISKAIETVFEDASQLETLPNDQETVVLLKAEIESYSRVFLVVDGLDEATHEARGLIQDKLLAISSKLSTLIMTREDDETDLQEMRCDLCDKVCIQFYHCKDCARLYQKVAGICFECKAGGGKCRNEAEEPHILEPFTPDRCEVEIITPDEDIASFVIASITAQFPDDLKDTDLGSQRRGRRFMIWKCFQDRSLLNKIVSHITENSDGRFLLAREYLKHFQNKNTMRDIKAALKNQADSGTEKVFPLYADDMARIMKQEPEDADLARQVFSTVYFAKRNLTLKELLQALATQTGDREYDVDGESDRTAILGATKGLIAIERSNFEDESTNGITVRFDHLTRREFFYHQYNWKNWFPDGPLSIARTCLTFLEFDEFAEPCQSEEEFQVKEEELPFVSYAVQFWGDHVREAGPDATEITSAAIKYLQEPHRVEAYIQAAWVANTRHRDKWDVRRDIHPLHICAWFDLSFLMTALKHDPKDINVQEDTHGQTPLMYACRRGSVETVRWLLELGALVNKRSEKGRTALFEALLRLKKDPGHNSIEDVGKSRQIFNLLLNEKLRGRQLDVNRRNPRHLQQTALITSIEWKQPELALAILKHPDVKVNSQDVDGICALHLAACNSFPDVVEKILQLPSTIVELCENSGNRSALHFGAQFADDPTVVEQLLDHGADPNRRDGGGGTPVLRAIEAGNDAAVEVLVSSTRDIKPDLTCTDENGRGLWHHAAAFGSVSMIELLNKWIPSRRNSRDSVEMTPLHDACKFGNKDAARKLLEFGTKSTVQDNLERTPYIIARQYGHEDLLDIFNPDEVKCCDTSADHFPLWSLATLRRLDIINKRIESGSETLAVTEPRTLRTALHCVLLAAGGVNAKEDTQAEILQKLLATGKLSADDVDRQKQTALHFAAMFDNIEATKILLSHDADPDIVDRFGMTPLRIACKNKNMTLAVELIEAGANIDKTKLDLEDLLFAALTAQKPTAVGRLIEAGANRMAQDDEGRTPEMVAKNNPRLVGILKSTKSFMWKATTMSEKEEISLGLLEDTIEVADEMLSGIQGKAISSPQLSINGKAAKDVRFTPFRSDPINLGYEKKSGNLSSAISPITETVRNFEQVEELLESISGKENPALTSRPRQDTILCE